MVLDFGEKFFKYPTAFTRLAIVIINNIYCIPTYVVWMAMLTPLKRFNPHVYYKIEGLFFHWLLAVVSLWSYSAGYDIVEVGDDINECKNKKTLVIANHQSTADVPLLMANFNAKENILPNLMWIMDRLFKYTNFGIVSIIHQDFFIASGRKNREESINALKKHIKTSFLKLDRKWMVLFPEGGFLRKRRAASQRFAEKNNLPTLEYVTLPRVGAFKAIIEAMTVPNNEETKQLSTSDCNNHHTNSNIHENCVDNNDDHHNENVNARSNSKSTYNRIGNNNSLSTSENNLSTASTKSSNNSIKSSITNNSTITSSKSAEFSSTKNNNDLTALNTSTTKLTNSSNSINSLPSITNSLSNGNLLENKLKEISAKSTSDCLLEYILDITIAYPNAIPLDLPNILHGWRDPCKTYMLYRLYKVSEIPKNENALTQWLYDRFIEKNELLQNFYQSGKFYIDRELRTNLIQQDVLRFVLINLFFITSTYLHYQLFCIIYSYCNVLIFSVL